MYGNGSRWGGVMYNYGYNKGFTSFASLGNWNDPDFTIAGDGGDQDSAGHQATVASSNSTTDVLVKRLDRCDLDHIVRAHRVDPRPWHSHLATLRGQRVRLLARQ
ncbi:hypothetical protein [Actinocrispum wychmicini]|uniref:Uncharacterized protein n=1 Tax=Actinocrispum wychmicini TaxID=1213861 RepID=A0A4R2JLG8_9PSEU|nr:hypothetical protein [Actinocrispum wychmicini]TCO59432.1 hypothetical protein EV192_104274 [Actinocrispum wychmicini]